MEYHSPGRNQSLGDRVTPLTSLVHLVLVLEMRKLEFSTICTMNHMSNVVRAIRLGQGSNGLAGNWVRKDWDFNGNTSNLITHTLLLLKFITRAVVALDNPQGGLGGDMRDFAGM
jgi:hypothetical protein